MHTRSLFIMIKENIFDANFNERYQSRDWLLSMLHKEVVSVRFVKRDGTERDMNCTLKEGIVVPYEKKTDKEKVRNEEVLAVWDIDKNEWRSFRWDSILSVTIKI